VPAHSFKFAAELQEKQTGNDPVLIRIDVKAGHGAGKSLAATIKKMSIFRHSRCIIWVSKNYQKLNNLDFIWANPAFRCIPDNKNYGKYLFFSRRCRFNQG
jgi:hypothetical protein